jgi:nucleoid-associated protein YgaU
MRKRALYVLALACACFAFAHAQSLLDNSFYQAGSDLALQAEAAYESGDYDAAADYAAQAEEYFAKSDEYVDMMLKYQVAQSAISKADERLAWADSIGAKRTNPDEYARAEREIANALAAADAAMAALAGLSESKPLPASYLVQLLPKDRDCLWKIAGLPWAYNDPWQWKKLFEANKNLLVSPNNPDLILPGQIIRIPSLYGEKREGQYDPKAIYEPLKKPEK